MSFLVKGLEMPECCTACPGFLISCGEPTEFLCGFTYGELDGRTIGKPDWCPLEEVPESEGE